MKKLMKNLTKYLKKCGRPHLQKKKKKIQPGGETEATNFFILALPRYL